MFPPTDNPAKRLVALLHLARGQDNKPVRAIWASVFSFSEHDTVKFYRAMGYLNNLVDSVEVRIRQEQGINHDLFLRDLPVIRKIISPMDLNVNWHSIKTPLDHGVLTGLEFCADKLSHSHSEVEIPEVELTSIKTEFSDLLKQVTDSEMPINLKLVLLDLLTSAIVAIENYKLTGNDGIKRSIAYILGMLTLHNDLLKDATDVSIMKKTGLLLEKMVTVVSTAYKIKELSAGLTKLLKFS